MEGVDWELSDMSELEGVIYTGMLKWGFSFLTVEQTDPTDFLLLY